ncbi:unnamed protein product, partial [Prorocentrum cordatum]
PFARALPLELGAGPAPPRRRGRPPRAPAAGGWPRALSRGVTLLLALLLPQAFRHVLYPLVLKDLVSAPRDLDIGKLGVLSSEELAAVVRGQASPRRRRHAGRREGPGAGPRRGRRARGGRGALRRERPVRPQGPPQSGARGSGGSKKEKPGAFCYIQGDLGTTAGSHALVRSLSSDAEAKGRFDYLAATAAVFPDWGSPLKQEDGLDKGFFIAVVGRFILYDSVDKFMTVDPKGGPSPHVRVLNVLASGGRMSGLDREVATGDSTSTSLFSNMITFAVGNEIMQMLLEQGKLGSNFGTTRLSTHPGFLQTDLHRGQGLLFDLFESLMVLVNGISEVTAGQRQASILASTRLHGGALNYVDDVMQGRSASAELQHEFDQHSDWLRQLIEQKLR